MADDDGFVTAYATPSTCREASVAEQDEFATAQREGRPARLPIDSVTAAGVELTQQEQAIWAAAFGADWALCLRAERALHAADTAVRAYRELQRGPRANLGKVV